ncbi:class I SAM-dependent methyltransferase [Bradyrhizobium sp. AUGA SZCCT0240]|uniref:class I SAM-dependent methyltransferase n=1 Tax=Bradyrhizobium sp. AUGA SZCCT0240 TaxID=2807669 RepID=UPI001BABF8AC|nr:class I SAM-dependent methyltransferase [Bradyrhizobium sp. AUGA SZCCT0240]MBR1257977.1 class I SAM-dependent methyltransferase [Bradyrhizobium sp. AUGA SZCCT0240]
MKTTGANDTLGSISPASIPDRSITYAIDVAKSLYRLMMRRVKRTADVVDSEYNLQNWQKMLASKSWLRAANLTDFLAPAVSTERLRKVDNKILRIDQQRYYRYRIAALGDLILRHAGNARQIVELGCGYGYNLFSLHLNRPDLTLKGFDIAPNGIAAGREIAGHFALLDKISLDRIDLTDANDPNFSAIAGAVVFTFFCIEQIPYDVHKVVENIIAAKPKRVINIEPTTELLDLTHPRDLVSLVYIRSVDYQTQLFTTLDELERQGRIRIIARERMPFAPNINNDGFLYCWEPI